MAPKPAGIDLSRCPAPVLWDRRVVDVQIVAGEDVGAEEVVGKGIDEHAALIHWKGFRRWQ